MKRYTFERVKTNFDGEEGYNVSQKDESGAVVVFQFVPLSSFDFFCNAIGLIPELVEG